MAHSKEDMIKFESERVVEEAALRLVDAVGGFAPLAAIGELHAALSAAEAMGCSREALAGILEQVSLPDETVITFEEEQELAREGA